MSTTMKRIRDRLIRQCWVPTLSITQQAELAIAAADVGDGRAADELTALARTWRRIAATQELTDAETAATYNMGAEDLEDRVAVLRAAPKLRRLIADRPDLGVTPETVAVESLACEHDVVLTLVDRGAVAAVRAWCSVLTGTRVELWTQPGDQHVVVTGLFEGCCSIRVAADLPADNPAVAAVLDGRTPAPGHRTRVDRDLLAQLDAAVASREQPVATPVTRACEAISVPSRARPASSNSSR